MVVQMRRQILRLAIISFLGIMYLALAINFSSVAKSQELPEPYYEDLVLAVIAGNTSLSPGIFSIQKNDKFYLPIGTLSDVLGFNVEYDRETRYVEGWSSSQDEVFTIDGNSRVLTFRGKTVQLPEDAIIDDSSADDDLYLLLEVYNQIWPLDFEVDFSTLVLRVIANDLLPFQEELKRKDLQKKIASQMEEREREAEEVKNYQFVAMPYQLFSKPALDLSVSAGFDAQTSNPEYLFSLNGVQDLAYASADYSLNLAHRAGSFKKPENFRLRFRRQNIHEGALPFGLEDTQWGDVNLRNRNLIATGRQGRGLIFSTRQDKFANEFDRITIDGTGTPGWETELYINDQLINFGVVDERGEYRFEDVSIGFGNNNVRVVLYGPQGQIKERNENYFYQSNMVKAGENEFSGGIIDSERDLIPLNERETARPKGLAANIYGARGISDRLTVFASANTIKDKVSNKEIAQDYLSVGAIGSVKSTLAQLELYKQLDRGQAAEVRTLSDFKGFKVNTQTAFYSDFESPDADNGTNAKKFQFEFDVKKVFSTLIGSLGLEAGVDYLKRENDRATLAYTTRQSLGLQGTRLSNQTRTNIVDSKHTTTSGDLSSTTRQNRWTVRNNLNYRLFPEVGASSFQTEVRYGKLREFSTAGRFQRNFNSNETILGFQVTKDFDKFLGSFDADWSSKFGTSFMLRATTSLGPYAPNDGYIMESDPLRNASPVTSFVFLDKDYDGIYTEGDEPVPNTKVAMGRRLTKEETDENGYLSEINPSAGTVTNVRVAKSSIDDPYLVSSPDAPGYKIYPRPGVVHKLDFPLIETGAIDGTLRWSGDREPIEGVRLQLMADDAEIIQSSLTATDGYFTFERVPPGSYTIRADPETGLNVPFKYVELTPDNLFQFGMDIDAVDLSKGVENDLEMGLNEDNLLSVKNIISIAKGYKDKKSVAPTQPITQETVKGVQKISTGGASAGPAIVQEVRIGEHTGKIRVVLDLSAPTKYSLNYDPNSNSVSLEMPYATWSARESWQNASAAILRDYKVERVGQGVHVMFGVQDEVKIGASGLLNANGDKKDRLYIDIEKK